MSKDPAIQSVWINQMRVIARNCNQTMVVVKHKLGFDFHSEAEIARKKIPNDQIIVKYNPNEDDYESVKQIILKEVCGGTK